MLRVEGIKELIANLRRVDAALPKELQRAHKAFADTLVPRVKSEYASHYPRPGAVSRRRRGKNTASQIRAVATQKTGGIRIGGVRYPYMPGQEWGSNRYKQFAPSTGGKGRFLRPTIMAAMPELRRRYLHDVLDPVLAKAFAKRGR